MYISWLVIITPFSAKLLLNGSEQVGWMAWTMDGYDFHTVSLSVSRLAKFYGQHREHISTSITLTLLFRSLGAAIFGIAGDLYGRKYPMIINLVIIAALQLATAYCATFDQFLGVRALFGIGMGGIWGLAASMGLESKHPNYLFSSR